MFQDISELRRSFADARRQQDFDDLQNELADRDTGRMKRFLTSAAHIASKARGARDRRAFLSRLQELLATNQAYADAYHATLDRLGELERAAERVREALTDRLQETEEVLAQVLADAARLPDGTRVFRDQQGQILTEAGENVSQDDAASILWRGDEPSYEAYVVARDAVNTAHVDVSDVEAYQTDVLGDARNRMMDEDDPPSLVDLESIGRRFEMEMPQRIRDALETDPESSTLDLAARHVEVPQL